MEKKPEQKEENKDSEKNKVLAFTEYKTFRKEIAISEFKGNTYLQVRQLWKKDENDPDWKFCKKIVSFSLEDFQSMIESLKENKITSPDQILKLLE